MKAAYKKERFLCPECGSEEPALAGGGALKRGSGRRRAYRCARCGCEIPAHLAERWGISPEEAKKEWREVYRGVGVT